MGDHLRVLGYGGSASAPIVVADRLWGVISVVWAQGRSVLPGSEDRLMQFGELIATALANAEARADLRQVAEEQAALRRVATRVARGEPPSAVFAAVAVEAGRVIPAADVALVGRYDPDDAIELVGGWSRDGDPSFVGDRVALGGHNVSTLVFQTNHPARRDHIPDDSTPASALARKWARSSAGAPINVEGRLWGVMIVGGADEDALPAGTEDRLAQFSELVATAIGNAEAREELRRVADEQAALRRVATVVARDEAPEAAFAAVAEELGHLFGAEATGVNRYEMDGTVTSVGSWNSLGEPITGTRTTLGGHNVTTLVFETGQPARIDRYDADDASQARASRADTALGRPPARRFASPVASGVRFRWRCLAKRHCPPGPRSAWRHSPSSPRVRSRKRRRARSSGAPRKIKPRCGAWRRWSHVRRRRLRCSPRLPRRSAASSR